MTTAMTTAQALESIESGIEFLRTLPGSADALAALEAHRANVAAGGSFMPPPARKRTALERGSSYWQDGGPELFR